MANQKMTIKNLDLVVEKILSNYDVLQENTGFLREKILILKKMKCVSDLFNLYDYDSSEKGIVKLASSSMDENRKCYCTRLTLIKIFPELAQTLDLKNLAPCDKCMTFCLTRFLEEGGRLRLKPSFRKQKMKKF